RRAASPARSATWTPTASGSKSDPALIPPLENPHMKSTLRALVGLSLVALAVVGIAFGIATPGAFHQPAAGDLALLGMGGIIVNRDNLNTIYTGFKTAFQGAFSGVTPDWNTVATLVPSATKTEDYA